MSSEVFEIIKRINLKRIETQLILQCTPVITNLKTSNLLIIEKKLAPTVRLVLDKTSISYVMLAELNDRVTFLLYDCEALEAYTEEEKCYEYLKNLGYVSNDLEEKISEFQVRYQNYLVQKEVFPHELGIFLGYPIEDVVGFIENKGERPLITGYWKVYSNPKAKAMLFRKIDIAQEELLRKVADGCDVVEIINGYHKKEEGLVAV